MSISEEFFEIDTKGKCLVCLKSCDGGGEVKSEGYQTAFKMLMRYLKVDVYKFANFSKSALLAQERNGCLKRKFMEEGLENVPMVLSLCGGCASLTAEFGELFDTMEYLRLQMDKRVMALRRLLEEDDKDGGRLGALRMDMMMSFNPMDLINLTTVENFRKEAIQKCSQKLGTAIPKVAVKKIETATSQHAHFQRPPVNNPVATFSRQQRPCPKSKKRVINSTQQPGLLAFKPLMPPPPPPPPRIRNQSYPVAIPYQEVGQSSQSIPMTINGPKIVEVTESASIKVEGGDDDIIEVPSGSDYAVNANEQVQPRKMERAKSTFPTIKSTYSLKRTPFGGGRGVGLQRRMTNQYRQFFYNSTPAPPQYSQVPSTSRAVTVSPSFAMSRWKMPPRRPPPALVSFPTIVMQCTVCTAVFPDDISLKQHMQFVHTNQKTHKCIHCGQESGALWQHRFHLVLCHPFQEFASQLPPGTTEDRLVNAIQFIVDAQRRLSPDNKVLYDCPACPKKLSNHPNLRHHLFTKHIDAVAEKLEELKALPEQQQPTSHPFRIGLPRFRYKTKRSFWKNLQPVVPPPLEPVNLQCLVCGKIMASKEGLAIHMQRHSEVKPYKCDLCGKGSNCQNSHDYHMLRYHPFETISKRRPSGISDDQLRSAITFIQDQQLARPGTSQNEVFGCPFCPKTFPTPIVYKLHMLKVHVGEVISALKEQESADN